VFGKQFVRRAAKLGSANKGVSVLMRLSIAGLWKVRCFVGGLTIGKVSDDAAVEPATKAAPTRASCISIWVMNWLGTNKHNNPLSQWVNNTAAGAAADYLLTALALPPSHSR
jgi:hypothetical protein